MIYLGRIEGRSYPEPKIQSHNVEIHKSVKQQQIEEEFNIKAKTLENIGKDAYEKAFEYIRNLIGRSEVSFNFYKDEVTGLEKVVITVDATGQVVKEFPPNAIFEITRKAKLNAYGWILDTFA